MTPARGRLLFCTKEMTLDCPFRNPLQPRVISVRSCYLTSFWLPLFLLNSHIPHHICSAFFWNTSSQRIILTALAVFSSNVRSWLLKGFRIACSGYVVRAYLVPNRLVESVIGCGLGSPFLGQGFLAGVFLSSGQGSCLGAAPYFRSLGLAFCRGFILAVSLFDLASWRQVLGFFLIHGTHPFWL